MIRISMIVLLVMAAGIDDLGIKNFALILSAITIFISLYLSDGRG